MIFIACLISYSLKSLGVDSNLFKLSVVVLKYIISEPINNRIIQEGYGVPYRKIVC